METLSDKIPFLTTYQEYASQITDAPRNYHDYIGLATVGIALGNRSYLPFGDTRIYPNLWLIILGNSSSSRKTTSINIGKRLINEVLPERIFPNEFSHEKIQTVLEKNPAGAFFFSEFGTLLGLLSRDYMAGAKGMLTDLFDSPFTYKRETQKDSVKIENPAVSIVSATTASWFTERLNEKDILGGFLPRFIMIQPGLKSEPMAIPPEADKEKRRELVRNLKQFSEMEGIFYLKEEARQVFSEYYGKLMDCPANLRIEAFISRLQIYALKFAMILSVINDLSLKISGPSMLQAIDLNWNVYKQLSKIEEEDLVFGKYEILQKKILDYLKKHGKQSTSAILRNVRGLSSKDFKEATQTLLDSERVKETKVKTSTKPVTYYEIE